MEAVQSELEVGATPRRPHGPDKAPSLRRAALSVLLAYESTRTKRVGIEAFLDDQLHDNPSFFLTQIVKLEPKAVSVESTKQVLQVVMVVDGAQEPKCVDSVPQAQLTSTPNATEQCLPDVVAESDSIEAPPQRTTGGGSHGRQTGPIQPGSRPLTAPAPKTQCPPTGHASCSCRRESQLLEALSGQPVVFGGEVREVCPGAESILETAERECPLPPHISKPSEVVSDFSDFKHTEPQVPWDPNWHPVARCPRCGAPVAYKGLVRNLPSYEHPVEGGDPVLIRQWAKCPNQE